MIALIVIIIGVAVAGMADENEGMQGFGLGVSIGAFVVGVGSWVLG